MENDLFKLTDIVCVIQGTINKLNNLIFYFIAF